jgi:hypothetical protein
MEKAERQAKVDEAALAIIGGPLGLELVRQMPTGLYPDEIAVLIYNQAEAFVAEGERRAKALSK